MEQLENRTIADHYYEDYIENDEENIFLLIEEGEI